MALQLPRRGSSPPTPHIRLVPDAPRQPPEEFIYTPSMRTATPSPTQARTRPAPGPPKARAASAPTTGRRVASSVLALALTFVFALVLRNDVFILEPKVRSDVTVSRLKPPVAAGTPMSVVASSITTNTASRRYNVSMSIRNPTDGVVSGITVRVVLRDGLGKVVSTQNLPVEVLASGATTVLTLSGEYVPGAGSPAKLEVSATAASAWSSA